MKRRIIRNISLAYTTDASCARLQENKAVLIAVEMLLEMRDSLEFEDVMFLIQAKNELNYIIPIVEAKSNKISEALKNRAPYTKEVSTKGAINKVAKKLGVKSTKTRHVTVYSGGLVSPR